MAEVEKLIEIYRQLENAGLMVTAGKKSAAELMVSHDVVPVVRCKDCKSKHEYSQAQFYCYLTGMPIDEDDFCSCGERKDND